MYCDVVRLTKSGAPAQREGRRIAPKLFGAMVHAKKIPMAETYSNCDGSERLPTIPGHEVSGVVESVAEGVGDVSIGDEVYALKSFCRDGALRSMSQSAPLTWPRNQRRSITRRLRPSHFPR